MDIPKKGDIIYDDWQAYRVVMTPINTETKQLTIVCERYPKEDRSTALN